MFVLFTAALFRMALFSAEYFSAHASACWYFYPACNSEAPGVAPYLLLMEGPVSDIHERLTVASDAELLVRARELLADFDLAGYKVAAAHMSRVVDCLEER